MIEIKRLHQFIQKLQTVIVDRLNCHHCQAMQFQAALLTISVPVHPFPSASQTSKH
jgi:hypothetical protein